VRNIAVVDESGLLKDTFKGSKQLVFTPIGNSLQTGKQAVLDEKYYAVLYVPRISVDNPAGIKLFSKKGISMEVEGAVERSLKKEIEDVKLQQAGIDKQVLERIDTKVSVDTMNLTDGEGERDSSTGAAFVVGFAAAFIIYISIFIYGVQVMRGVIEEKTNRIVEVIISSVKPFQLMIGKITGIALVGSRSFCSGSYWVLLSVQLPSAFSSPRMT
jgi:ABC-2 type transport system permease protein